jgi:outer membrane protein assembly factor BamB
MRRALLTALMVVLAGLARVDTRADEGPWPMFRHDLNHTGRSPYTGPADSTPYWAFPVNDGIASSPTIGADGTIYVGSGMFGPGNSDSSLYAINPDGSLKWRFKTGYGVFSSPAIGPDGTIYVGSQDQRLYAIEDSSTYPKSKWNVYLGSPVWSSPAVGEDGTIYVGSLNFFLYALWPDGTAKWGYHTLWCIFSSPAIGPDGAVYVGSKDEALYVFEDSTTYAKLRWKHATGQFYDGHLVDSSPAIGEDGTIYVGTDPYGAAGHDPVPVDTVFFAINPDGSRKWAFPMEDGAESSPAIGPDGTIYVGSYDGHLYAIADSGTKGILKWKFLTGGAVASSPAVDACGTIYIGSRDSTMYALNPDGTLRWSFRTNGEIESSPAIGDNGILYFGSFDGNLYAIGTGAPDLGVVSVEVPDSVKTNSSYSPSATVVNYRGAPQSFEVACLIDTQGTYLHGDTVYVSNLAGGGSVQEVFSPWNVGSDNNLTYTITVVTILSEDDNEANDTLSRETVSVSELTFLDGDANGDGTVDVGDVVYLISYQYKSGPAPNPVEVGDANCDGIVNIGDVVYLVSYLYKNGPPPSC